MNSRTIRLHGGPRHGVMITAPIGYCEVIVVHQPVHGTGPGGPDDPVDVQVRHGEYSIVNGSPNDYEWDGWKA